MLKRCNVLRIVVTVIGLIIVSVLVTLNSGCSAGPALNCNRLGAPPNPAFNACMERHGYCYDPELSFFYKLFNGAYRPCRPKERLTTSQS